MNNIVLCIVNAVLIFPIAIFSIHYFDKILEKVKLKQTRTNNQLKQMQEQLKPLQDQVPRLEAKVDDLLRIIQSLKNANTNYHQSKDPIEHQYERAKNLLEKGLTTDHELFKNTHITEEELELLSHSLVD